MVVISLPSISYTFNTKGEAILETIIVACIFIGLGKTDTFTLLKSSIPNEQSLLFVLGVPCSKPGAAQASQFSPKLLSNYELINSNVGPLPSASVGHGSISAYVTESTKTSELSNNRINSPPPLNPNEKLPKTGLTVGNLD